MAAVTDRRSSHVPTAAVRELTETLGPTGVRTADEDLGRYEVSPNLWSGHAGVVVRPRTTEDVRAALRICRAFGLTILPQGANSGLVGGSVPDDSGRQVVLSTERMRSTFAVDPDSRTLVASAGWTLDEIQERLAAHGLRFPIEVGSSPNVGGMVSTNTAGANVVRYGDVRTRLLGVEAVLADAGGTVIDTLSPVRKRNEGFDATQLFVGTQGEYGVVTAAGFELDRLPTARAAAWISLQHNADLLRMLAHVERACAETLTCFELVSPTGIALLHDEHEHLLQRLPRADRDCILVELGTADSSAEDLLLRTLESAAGAGLLDDAVTGDPEALWEVRRVVPSITERMAPALSYDVSVARGAISALRSALRDRLTREFPAVIPIELGHVADGGLHLILQLPADPDADTGAALDRLVFDTVVRDFAGSFSAEHGVGPKNAAAYREYVPAELQMLREQLRRLCDPDGVLAGWTGQRQHAGPVVAV